MHLMNVNERPKGIIPDPGGGAKHSSNGHAAILTEAQQLHKRGLWVVPCAGKQATLPGWPEKRLTGAELDAALSGSTLNIAIVLSQSDMIDVECDSEEAETNLQVMFGGEIPATPTWQSKRGKHRLFRRPQGLPVKAKMELDGIEFRIGNGRGALSIVPPSVHPDGLLYRWLPGLSIHDVEPAELPDEIVERLCGPSSQPTPEPSAKGGIPEGRRNDELFKLACKLVKAGLGEESVETALMVENAARCTPPLPSCEVAVIARSARSRGTQNTQSTQTHAEILLGIALADSELWRTPDDKAHATIRRDGHREHWPIKSKGFTQWLASQFYAQTQRVASSQSMQDVLNTLEGKATFEGSVYPRHLRVAEHEGRIYIDLADGAWRAIEVDATGWRIVADPPVRFHRPKRMLPLTVPERGGTIADLRRFVNVADEDWPLVLAWLVGALRPASTYSILKFSGEQGSAKSTQTRVLRAFVDPNICPTRGATRSERDLMIAAENGWVCAFDNLSYITPELSDALCRLSTGGGWGVRSHYENDEETVFNAKRPIILNGIEDVGTRSDLMDRSLIIELPRFNDEDRLPETVLHREFEAAQPGIFGALLDAVSAALRNLPSVEQSKTVWPRMADFAQWAVAAEEALGLNPGEFLQAYWDNRNSANQTALDSSVIVPQLKMVLSQWKGFYQGTATHLLNELSIGIDTRAREWPKSPRALSGKLSRLAPNLRLAGMKVEQSKAGNEKLWRIEAPGYARPEPATPANSQHPQTGAPKPTGRTPPTPRHKVKVPPTPRQKPPPTPRQKVKTSLSPEVKQRITEYMKNHSAKYQPIPPVQE